MGTSGQAREDDAGNVLRVHWFIVSISQVELRQERRTSGQTGAEDAASTTGYTGTTVYPLSLPRVADRSLHITRLDLSAEKLDLKLCTRCYEHFASGDRLARTVAVASGITLLRTMPRPHPWLFARSAPEHPYTLAAFLLPGLGQRRFPAQLPAVPSVPAVPHTCVKLLNDALPDPARGARARARR